MRQTLKLGLAATIVLAAGCAYRASFRDCAVSCAGSADCPAGFTCGAEGLCRAATATQTCAAVLGDASLGDGSGSNDSDLTDGSSGSITPVQARFHPHGSPSTACAVSTSQPIMVGDLLIVHTSWTDQGATTATIADSRGSTWASIVGRVAHPAGIAVEGWYAIAASSGAETVTVTLSGAQYADCSVAEYRGNPVTGSLDARGSATGHGAPLAVMTTGPTAAANELVWAVACDALCLDTWTNGAGYQPRAGGASACCLIEDKIPSGSGAHTATFVLSNIDDWVGVIATFPAS